MKRATILCLILLLGACLNVNAQDFKGMFNFSPFGGIGLPMGELSSEVEADVLDGDAAFRKMGFKFGAAAEYFFTANLAAGVSFRYVSFGSKEIELMGATFASESKLTGMMFGAHGKYVFGSEGMMRPYIIAGAGMFMSTYKDVEGLLYELEETLEFDVDSKFYFMFGAGMHYFVSPTISVFGEATLDYAMTDGAKLDYDGTEIGEIGTNYYFIDFIVGLNIWFGGYE